MFNISSIGRKTVNPYGTVAKINKVETVNPFFQEDSLTISDDAMILSAALNEAKASLAIEMNKLDGDKISALKEQIASGKYSVSSRDVAAKIMAD